MPVINRIEDSLSMTRPEYYFHFGYVMKDRYKPYFPITGLLQSLDDIGEKRLSRAIRRKASLFWGVGPAATRVRGQAGREVAKKLKAWEKTRKVKIGYHTWHRLDSDAQLLNKEEFEEERQEVLDALNQEQLSIMANHPNRPNTPLSPRKFWCMTQKELKDILQELLDIDEVAQRAFVNVGSRMPKNMVTFCNTCLAAMEEFTNRSVLLQLDNYEHVLKRWLTGPYVRYLTRYGGGAEEANELENFRAFEYKPEIITPVTQPKGRSMSYFNVAHAERWMEERMTMARDSVLIEKEKQKDARLETERKWAEAEAEKRLLEGERTEKAYVRKKRTYPFLEADAKRRADLLRSVRDS